MTQQPVDAQKSSLHGHEWVVFGPDWGRHPSVSQHLFSQFLGSSPVLWVETVGLRAPTLSRRDCVRSCQKLADFLTRRRRRAVKLDGLTVVSPPTLPFTRWHWVRRFNLWQVRRHVTAAIHRLGFKQPKLVVTVPSQCDFVGQLGESVSIYYCIDDYALWKDMQPEHVRRLETALIQGVDGIVVACEALKQRMASAGKPLLLLSHGVDLTHFQSAPPGPPNAPFEMVYFGLIDERVDQELLVSVARALPTDVLRLIGPVTVPVSRLKACPNIQLEGSVAYESLPKSVASASLFLLPFHFNELSRSCSPIKIKEYLACGKPIVATAIPEVVHHATLLASAPNREAFLESVLSIRHGNRSWNADQVSAYLADETWQAKARIFAATANRWSSDKALMFAKGHACTSRLDQE